MYSKKQVIKIAAISCVIALLAGVLGATAYHKIDSFLNEDVLSKAKRIVLQNYVDPISEEKQKAMEDAALTAMVATLDDPYSYYFDTEVYGKFEASNNEEYIGIGVNVFYDPESKTLIVTSSTAGGPAEKAGILPQDKVLGAGELTVEKDGYEAVISHIKSGKEGDEVKLFIERNGEKLEFLLKVQKVIRNTISEKMLDNGIAYIKITEFQHNSTQHFKNALDSIKEKGAKGLIIDLRGNPGGYVESVSAMTDMLLPECTIAYLEDNKGNKEYIKSDKKSIDLPMVVLVNEGTASASELMAGSLQAHDKAEIVGMKTYGKAVGQMPYMLTERTAIYLTRARYYTPKGECIDKKGIVPDIEIDLPEEAKANLSDLSESEDVQLQVAIETLIKKIK